MVLKNKFFCTLVSSLFLNFGIPLKINASPQIPNAVAENICWYVSKGLPVGLATTYALDPKMLLIDEKGVTPMYVAKNGLFITNNIKKYFENDKDNTFSYEIAEIILNKCGEDLTIAERDSFKKEVQKYKSSIKNDDDKNIKSASKEDIFLYEGIGATIICLGMQRNIDFKDLLALASNTMTSVIMGKHGSLVEDYSKTDKIDNKQMYNSFTLTIFGRVIQTCPDKVPSDLKEKYNRKLEDLKS